MIDQLLEDLKRDEGFRAYVYEDTEGWQTLGYGFLVDERKGVGIPAKIADAWLAHAAIMRWQALLIEHPWMKQQPEGVQRAMANMAYNLGVKGVGNFKRMLAALKAGDREKAAKEALNSKWATQVGMRANRIASLIRSAI